MSPLSQLATLLRDLPRPWRRAIYSAWTLIGAVLAVCQGVGIDDLGPVTMTQALQGYAALSPFIGGLAAVNAAPTPEVELVDYDEDFDDSSFTGGEEPDPVYA
jgi:hypothetical protein